MRITEEKELRTTMKAKPKKHGDLQRLAKAEKPPPVDLRPDQLGSLISSPLRREIVKRSSALAAPQVAESRPDTPQAWIADNRNVLAAMNSGSVPRSESRSNTDGVLFRQMVKDFGLRTVGVRKSSALERALLSAQPAEVLLHQHKAAVNMNRVL
jgi:hypothetical protein